MQHDLRILIVDDNDQLRLGIKTLLQSIEGISSVEQAANGQQALDLVFKNNIDLVLMDVGMPVMDGIEACQSINKFHPSVKVIMLTSHDADEDVFAALAAGANGYCLKEADFERLVNAIRCVASGDLWLDSQIAAKIANLSSTKVPESKSGKGAFQELSPREIEVLNLVVDGLSNKEIAARLKISTETVKSHTKHIMDKMAVSDRTQMAVKALRSGLA